MLPSGILEVVTSNMEDEDAARFIRDIKAKYTNVEKGNNGKILVIAKDSEQNKANFTPISQEQEGSFKELKQICTETIVTACQWFPSLAGIATEGKLGSNQQLSQEFEIASRYVSRQQKKIIDVITKIVALTNSPENFTITFINNKPGNVSKLTEKVNSDQIVMFSDLLSAAIAEIDPIKKKAIINSFIILFGFTENEANSMVNGTDITSN
jgi:aryl-alcohol dehydrogenase-like predicted oxidoreductase